MMVSLGLCETEVAMIVQTDWAALAQRVAGQIAKSNIEGRGAVVWQDDVLIASGSDGDPVIPALRAYLADEPICKELGIATSCMTWAMLLQATEDREDIAELCDALNEFMWEVWLAANG